MAEISTRFRTQRSETWQIWCWSCFEFSYFGAAMNFTANWRPQYSDDRQPCNCAPYCGRQFDVLLQTIELVQAWQQKLDWTSWIDNNLMSLSAIFAHHKVIHCTQCYRRKQYSHWVSIKLQEDVFNTRLASSPCWGAYYTADTGRYRWWRMAFRSMEFADQIEIYNVDTNTT